MNVLRSPNYLGKAADIGEHRFSYALYPHSGDVEASIVYEKAFDFNTPITAVENRALGNISRSFIQTDNDKIIIDSIKKSEDKSGYIIKMYNCSEKEQSCRITSDLFEITDETNFAEKKIKSCDNVVKFNKFEAKAFFAK